MAVGGEKGSVIKVTVRTILDLKRLIGSERVTLPLERGSTLGDLVRALIEEFGQGLASRIVDESTGKPYPYLRFVVNGRDIAFLQAFDTVLNEGDEILIIPPVGGG
ncbi:MAG: MoaD family protein [Deltaproteobacteria bacterium]|nr:MoaD family protein [Deltaproteobacteria bacterium]MBW2138318.1 MoaD family protein [Deltaproteobacteria bacterium]